MLTLTAYLYPAARTPLFFEGCVKERSLYVCDRVQSPLKTGKTTIRQLLQSNQHLQFAILCASFEHQIITRGPIRVLYRSPKILYHYFIPSDPGQRSTNDLDLWHKSISMYWFRLLYIYQLLYHRLQYFLSNPSFSHINRFRLSVSFTHYKKRCL